MMSENRVPEEGYAIEVRVVEIQGRGICPIDIKVGDLFHSDQEVAAACHWAAHTLLPFTTALRFGGNVPWEPEPGVARICCPDPGNPVVFEVKRVGSGA
jgi:uncharacterized repeat protein (TIGR04076 family)